MEADERDVVTGAFGFTGKYITRRLLESRRNVLTLTGHPKRSNSFGERVQAVPFNFDNPPALAESLRGASTLYNTYWIRFPYGGMTYEKAVANTKRLLEAAQTAGVRRVVHISIANPTEGSFLPYYRGKAILETEIAASGLSYAIIRPTVMFGDEGILINNIAWLLRRWPVFALPGTGKYGLQPVFVADVAEMAVRAGQADRNTIADAAGPETFRFGELVRLVRRTVRSRAIVVPVPPALAMMMVGLVGRVVRDVVLTGDEIKGLMANLLVSRGAPAGKTRLSEWLRKHASTVGMTYASELKRHYR